VNPFHLPSQNLYCPLPPQAEHEPIVEIFAIFYDRSPGVLIDGMGCCAFRLVSAAARILGTLDEEGVLALDPPDQLWLVHILFVSPRI
jgi:hypothetical protein